MNRAVGFQQSPVAPVQPNANWPVFKIEAAFGYQPGNQTGAMPVWTDITTQATDEEGQVVLKAVRGRDFEVLVSGFLCDCCKDGSKPPDSPRWSRPRVTAEPRDRE